MCHPTHYFEPREYNKTFKGHWLLGCWDNHFGGSKPERWPFCIAPVELNTAAFFKWHFLRPSECHPLATIFLENVDFRCHTRFVHLRGKSVGIEHTNENSDGDAEEEQARYIIMNTSPVLISFVSICQTSQISIFAWSDWLLRLAISCVSIYQTSE